jgi:hypothetical protein
MHGTGCDKGGIFVWLGRAAGPPPRSLFLTREAYFAAALIGSLTDGKVANSTL